MLTKMVAGRNWNFHLQIKLLDLARTITMDVEIFRFLIQQEFF